MTIRASDLRPPRGATHSRKRIGRGNSSGQGTYAGKGLKGQKSRSGKPVYPGFEGGNIPFYRKVPHLRGFNNDRFRVEYEVVNVEELDRFDDGTEVTLQTLLEARVVRNLNQPVKILGRGDLSRRLSVTADAFSASARAKIEAAGGTATRVDGAPMTAESDGEAAGETEND
jgi:large subunit ribosomal protein L15